MAARFVLLGAAQDAGVPQIACLCVNCQDVRQGRAPAQWAVCGALLDDTERTAWLIDCGPDIKHQWDLLQLSAPGYKIEGVFLTHLHMGHYFGLGQFGKEALNMKGLKVAGTKLVCDFLRANQPWATGIRDRNYDLVELTAGQRFTLGASGLLSVTPISVPHRAEYSDCVAYQCHGPTQQILYLPDIDSWEDWDAASCEAEPKQLHTQLSSQTPSSASPAPGPQDTLLSTSSVATPVAPSFTEAAGPKVVKYSAVRNAVSKVDIAFLDACFFDASEYPPGRVPGSIPHPLVVDTLVAMQGLEHKVVLFHMNHTNSLWRQDSQQHKQVTTAGLRVGQQGIEYSL